MALFWDEGRVRGTEQEQQRQAAKMFLQEIRLAALETGEPPDVLAVIREAARWFYDPYRSPLLEYAIELLEGKPKESIPPEAFP